MTTSRPVGKGAARRARTHVHRVAAGATALALATYLLACTAADVVVVTHANASIADRLSARLDQVALTLPRAGPSGPLRNHEPGVADDLGDAPIVLWWVAPGDRRVVPLESNAPHLPRSALEITHAVDVVLSGRTLRLIGRTVANGRLIAATSVRAASAILSALITLEGVLAPVLVVTLYLAAWVIGRQAAAPIERARQRQLEFTADASHELRTPLSVIEAEVGLALHTERDPGAYRDALLRVAGESQRLRGIVEDLLWLARVDSLPHAPPDDTVDLASVASVCAARFRSVAAERGITVAVVSSTEPDAPDRTDGPGETFRRDAALSPEAAPAMVVAPAEWLDRLVSVLLDNACRHAGEEGRVEVEVTATEDEVTIAIDDSGPGIAADQREQIFERFHRASALPGGAGLGLSIADAVVTATGGSWTVETSPLGGARFAVTWHR